MPQQRTNYKLKITGSDAQRPILLKMAFNTLKKLDAWQSPA